MKFLYISNLVFEYKDAHAKVPTTDPVCWKECFEEGEFKNYKEVTLDFCNEFDLVMILLLPIHDALDKYLEIVQNPNRKYKTICYIDGPVGVQHSTSSEINKVKFFKIVRASDHILSYGEEARGYFEVISGGKPVHFVEMPYPVDYVKSLMTPVKDKALLISIGKGVANLRYDRNVTSSLGVFAKIQKKHPKARALILPAERNKEISGIYEEMFGAKNVLENEMVPWFEYVRRISPCYMGIHLDLLHTRGQYPLELAGLKIPCICSGSIAGRRLFPYTFLSNPWDVDTAAQLGIRLIEDKEFYRYVANYAFQVLDSYSFKNKRNELIEIIEGR